MSAPTHARADAGAASTMRRALGAAAMVAVTALIGWVDYTSGPDIGFSLFYLIPVTASGLLLGRGVTVVTAVAASASWFAADYALRDQGYLWISVWNSFTRLAIFSGIGLLTATTRRDRDRLRQMLAREATLARTDPLTGLCNSRALLETIDRELARARRTGESPCAVVYLDLDNFKRVNDGFGHAEGDRLLGRVGEALVRAIRVTDVAARVGGDEFVVLLWNVDRDRAEQAAKRIIAEVKDIAHAYPGTGLGISAGLAYFARPPEQANADALLRQADAALYEAKRSQKGTLVLADHM